MNKTIAYILVFLMSLVAMIVSCAILVPDLAGAVIFLTLFLGTAVLFAIASA